MALETESYLSSSHLPQRGFQTASKEKRRHRSVGGMQHPIFPANPKSFARNLAGDFI